MDRRAHLRVFAALIALSSPFVGAALPSAGAKSAGIAAALAPAAHAAVYATREQALATAFPGARIEARRFVLDADDVHAVQALARIKLASKLVSAHLAWRNDSLIGTAFIDARNVRTMPGVFLVVVAPDTTIERAEVLAFHEPPDYLPPARWLALLADRPLDDRLWPGRDLHHLSGATLTARSVTEVVRASLALYRRIVAPSLAAHGTAAGEARPPVAEASARGNAARKP